MSEMLRNRSARLMVALTMSVAAPGTYVLVAADEGEPLVPAPVVGEPLQGVPMAELAITVTSTSTAHRQHRSLTPMRSHVMACSFCAHPCEVHALLQKNARRESPRSTTASPASRT